MTNTWIGGTSGDWFTASNWSAGLVPQDKAWDAVEIAGTSANPVTVTYAQVRGPQINVLNVDGNATLSVTVTQADLSSTVFSVNSVNVRSGGTLTINTPNKVDLGSNPTVDGTLSITDASSVAISSTSVSGSGTLILNDTTLGGPSAAFRMDSAITTVLEGGARLYVDGTQAGKKIVMGRDAPNGARNQIVLTDYNQVVNTTITGWDSASTVTVFKGGSPPISASLTSNGNGTYTLSLPFDAWKNEIKFTNISFGPNSSPGVPRIVTNPDGSWSVADLVTGSNGVTCFLPGTMILTPDGERAIETLRAGDLVTVYENGTHASRPLLRVGRAHATLGNTGHADFDSMAVRIRANALADGVPNRDLLVTPEHCLLLRGSFIPVRMLVNETTIAYDPLIGDYDYHHIETARHAILIANATPTESFMDVDQRVDAIMDDSPVIPLRARSWADAAAPLRTDREFVEPIFAALAFRAKTLGQARAYVAPVRTLTSGPHLLLQDGTTVFPIRHNGEQCVFMIPQGCRAVRIISATGRPSDQVGPFVDDRRSLGLLVGTVRVWTQDDTQRLTDHLTDPYADGWWPIEDEQARWTGGNARIDLGAHASRSEVILSLEIKASGVAPNVQAA